VRLVDLGARFFRLGNDAALQPIDTLAGAQCVRFYCPKCLKLNGGPSGTHTVLCLFRDRGVANSVAGLRWSIGGSSLANLTLLPSVQLVGGCSWHGWITQGVVRTV
jgi:hypothetical protein